LETAITLRVCLLRHRYRAMAAPEHRVPGADPDQPPAAALDPGVHCFGGEKITLAPLAAAREAVSAPSRPSRAFGIVLAGVVLLFAFLVSSTAIRNSDFWLHLAAGRLLANGEYPFGTDPFFYTSVHTYWVNHAWLFDLGLYAIFQTFGGLGLVLLKALAITALAWLMLRVHRPESPVALPAACTLLALLAMSPRLLMQPSCVSLLLLGISFYLLWRPHSDRTAHPKSEIRNPKTWFGFQNADFGLSHIPLLLVFALWANLDEWFFLGPVLVALFWAGERLDATSRRQTPGWLVPAGFAACLLNPHFFRVFTSLPPELTPGVWASELHGDPRFRIWFPLPWQLDYYFDRSAGLNAAGLAYFALVALGLTSFALCRRHLVGWRLLVWGAFALLSAWHVRTVGFFAVVAGPITALNLQDVAAELAEIRNPKPEIRNGSLWARMWELVVRIWPGVLLVLGLALAVLTWPGWLQAVPHEHHRVAWNVQANPSLQRVAESLHRWRQERLLSEEERVFFVHPDVAHYCAWFAPGEKDLLDIRSPLFSRLVPQYEAVCRATGLGRTDETRKSSSPVPSSEPEWREVLRDYGISVVVVYDAEEQRLYTALHRLGPATAEWDLLRIDGRALVFGWKGSRPGGSFGRLHFDPRRLAFGPVDYDAALPPAPAFGPQRSPKPREWWERFLTAAPAPGWQSDAATMYLRYSEERAPFEQRHALASHAAGLVGAAAPGTPVAIEQVVLRLVQDIPGFGTRQPDSLLLAVRAARLAIATNPEDANAWLLLGQAYYALHRATDEISSSGHSHLLGLLRHVQIATALEHALVLDPDLEPAHEGLSVLYGERMFLDAALEYRRHALRLTRRAGPRKRPEGIGETEKAFRQRLKAEETAVRELEQVLQDRKNDYAIRSRAMSGDPMGRAQLALSLGLARVALDDVLLQSPVQTFGGEGARLELEILLQFGQAERVRGMLDEPEMRENRDKLEFSRVPAPARPGYLPFYHVAAYDWLRFLQSAATGDYAVAAEALEELVRPQEESSRRARYQLRSVFPLALAAELGLSADPQLLFPRMAIQGIRWDLSRNLTDVSFVSAQRADLHVLGGLLATERGSPAAALQSFNAALAAAAERTPPGDFASAPLAAAYLRRLQAGGVVR
jgi:tetratricopeptide (TPR) repeat protein